MSHETTGATESAAEFVYRLRFDHLPEDALRIAKRCILDGVGLIFAGSLQKCTEIVRRHALAIGGAKEATLFGKNGGMAPAPLAAFVNGTAGHAMDWDDTQLSATPDRIYGLLTHPTMPPLTACMAVSEKLGKVSGKAFLTAFLAGFEVECKIAEAVYPEHYKRGFHSSGTIGTFGAAMAAAKLMALDVEKIRHVIGIAASMSSGIRVNFGTMTKPLHVGRASQNGMTAAFLAGDGFEANTGALDGPWGFFQVTGGGFDPEKMIGALGRPFNIVSPGVSIKPYPCGVLTHPSMDTMLALVTENDLRPDDIEGAVLYAGSNILKPIRYETAHDELEAKFCMPFLLAAVAISRKAGMREFTPEFVNSAVTQGLMRRIRTEFDPQIEARGWDKIRSRLEIKLADGRTLIREADERYRGGPENPLSDAELQAKFSDCTDSLLSEKSRKKIFQTISDLDRLDDVGEFLSMLRS